MKCFACDRDVSGDDMDRPTGRYYCTPCFAPTIEEQFRQTRKEFNESIYENVAPEFDEGESLPLCIEDHGDEDPD